jgi:hypothetical protein
MYKQPNFNHEKERRYKQETKKKILKEPIVIGAEKESLLMI